MENGTLKEIRYIPYDEDSQSDSGDTYYSFMQEIATEPHWYLDYVGSIVTEEEWNSAFEFNADTLSINIGGVIYQKDGNIYHIIKTENGETVEHYYSAQDGGYFRYDKAGGYSDWAEFDITEISADEFDAAVRAPSLDEFTYGEFALNDEDIHNICYLNAEFEIVFSDKRVCSIIFVDGQVPFASFSYEEKLTLPLAKMTEDEWSAAIEASFEETNFMFSSVSDNGKTGYDNYFDMENGIIFRDSRYGDETEDQLFIEEDGTLYRYTVDGNGELNKEAAEYSSLQKLRDYLMREVLNPSALNGQTIAGNYGNFDYQGSGIYTCVMAGQVEVSFKDGKVERVSLTVLIDNEPVPYEYTFVGYGETDVNGRLPYWYLNHIENVNK